MSKATHRPGGRQVFDAALIKEGKIREFDYDEFTDGATPKYAVVEIPSDIHEDASKQDLDFTFPAKCIVHAVFIDVTTEEESAVTETVDVGRGTNTDGFLDSVDVSNEGIVKGSLADGVATMGDLFYVDDAATAAVLPEPDVTSGGEVLNITPAGNDFEELEGNVIVVYTEIS